MLQSLLIFSAVIVVAFSEISDVGEAGTRSITTVDSTGSNQQLESSGASQSSFTTTEVPQEVTSTKVQSLLTSSEGSVAASDSTLRLAGSSLVATSRDGTNCHPQCAWKCDTPVCNQVCDPVCEAPKCRTTCSELPCSRCEVKCAQPVCEVSS